jgi:two-component system NtrC family sensor kinase
MGRMISRQLVVTMAIVTLGVIGLLSYSLISSHQRVLLAQLERHAQGISETIKSSTRYAMLLNRRADVHRTIETLGNQEEILSVRIFNKEGKIIYSPDASAIGVMVDKQAEACNVCHAADRPLERPSLTARTREFATSGAGRSLGIINPIYNEPGCWLADCHAHPSEQRVLGVLDVTMSLADADRTLAAEKRKALLISLVAILGFSLILWFGFHRLVGKPVKALVEATNAVSSGDLGYRIEIKREDELGQLGRSFNEMTRKLVDTQAQLFQSNKLASLGRLAAGVAHEINNPLTGVLTYSSFLLKRAPEDSEIRSDLETIVHETKRCRDIVKGLLDFSRQAPPRKVQLEINALVDRALSILENQIGLAGIDVHRSVGQELLELRADANQLLQVLINLLVNAVDAIGKNGGEITISTDVEGGSEGSVVVIEVTDTGCGIPYEDQAKIFEPFFTSKGQKGTGLGLAVVWAILEQHGGSISVKSAPGNGTVFTVRLPVEKDPALVEKRKVDVLAI